MMAFNLFFVLRRWVSPHIIPAARIGDASYNKHTRWCLVILLCEKNNAAPVMFTALAVISA